MQYRALKHGYANGKVIEPNEEFWFEGPQGTWMEPVLIACSETADGDPPTPVAAVPSTNPSAEDAGLEDLLKVMADETNKFEPDEFTEKGFLRKSAFEKRLGRAVPQGVFLSYIKHSNEHRTAAN